MKSTISAFSDLYSVWKFTSFRHLWLGQIGSQLANNTLLFVLAIRIYQITGSNIAVSGLYLVYAFPAVFLGLAAGAIVDKINPKTVLFYCDIIRAFLVLILIFIPQSLIVIYIVALLNATLTQFYVPAEAPTIPRLVKGSSIVAANSLFAFTYYSSLAIGSVLAGPLMRIFGSNEIFLFLSGLFFLSSYFISKISNSDVSAPYRISTLIKISPVFTFPVILREIKKTLIYIRSNNILTDALMLLIGSQIVIAIIASLGPGFADTVLGIDVRDASVILMGPAVFGIITGALSAGTLNSKIASEKMIKFGLYGAFISLILIYMVLRIAESTTGIHFMSLNIFLPIVMVLFFLLGFSNALLDVPANSKLQTYSDSSMRGKVYGFLAAGVGSIGILPVVAGGFLADYLGVDRVILILSLIIFLYIIFRKKHKII